MDARLARYPFLSAAREAVIADDADLASLVADGQGRAVERAMARVESAIESGTVGGAHRDSRVELLSYPVARVLVSLVDDPGLTRRYAHAEAETATARFRDDREGASLKSVDREPLTLEALLEEFGLADVVEPTEHGFRLGVSTYLSLADGLDGERWRLVSRELADGAVPVAEDEFHELLREAIHDRVAEGLPLTVPDEIADALAPRVAEVRSQLADHGADWEFDEVDTALFPPCVDALLERAAGDGELPDHSRFALASFLATVGLPTQVAVDRLAAHPSLSEAAASSLLDHVADASGAEYPPPSCATMVAYGDCVNQDALCDRIGHPLEYYRRRLDGADPAALEAEP
ncbi:MAG: DNA primase large subunit PriL [Halobacteriales archaeon]|nr:DNA primase large subunit PriL [Halobacteriales archaeon]